MVSVSPSPPFQFRLRTLLLLFVVLGSSLGVFGAWGIVVFGLVVGLAISIQWSGRCRWLVYLGLVVLHPPVGGVHLLLGTYGVELAPNIARWPCGWFRSARC